MIEAVGRNIKPSFWQRELYPFIQFVHITVILITDGRSLRHKYFKDYKDYLGKKLKWIKASNWILSKANMSDIIVAFLFDRYQL